MKSLNRFSDPFYCIMRLVVGLMFACHGLDKIFGAFTPKEEALPTLMLVGGWVEIACGFLVAFGLLTRLAAFITSGEMAVAYFMIHVANAPTPAAKFFPILNHGELAVFYCWVLFFIFFYGSGRLSLDSIFCRKSETTTASTA